MLTMLGGIACLSVSGYIFIFVSKRPTLQTDAEF